ncbi:hypothetical protein [Synechococcus sp. CCAP 1479/9]|uniref:hypothetical protein n=1 Tax=Synechococcus sp. CCAP 1479/9 TaxID=1221593 RepID=UPI001C23F1AF|nr:hypothetical protein [Synechococcus sp. CCAP 1479/9]
MTTTTDAPPPGPPCPRCGNHGIPIVRGFPGPETAALALIEKVKLGGCLVGPGQPAWWCASCDEGFWEPLASGGTQD